eukprot:TRINITY_DN337_c0_g1_i3.p1 TRINITY_DN337_c0_g1~~TRINITY_DN337_c0_g1_i3.p1  ORF type:complete len:200 (-),score=37.88 TRINITY_DN337_c0_g1_i3:71-670(-)
MNTFKCVVVGDGTVGKTCLLMSFSFNTFPSSYVPTVFDNYNTVVMVDGNPYSLALWDTAGQDDYNRLRALCYPGTDVFLLCFSVTFPDSYDNVKNKWHGEIIHFNPGTPFLVVGMKIDIRDDPSVIQELSHANKSPITKEEGEQLTKDIGGVKYMECSALTQVGVKELFDEIVRTSINTREGLSNLQDIKRKKKGCSLL